MNTEAIFLLSLLLVIAGGSFRALVWGWDRSQVHFLGSLFGGKSSSSTTASTKSETTAIDLSSAEAENILALGNNSSYSAGWDNINAKNTGGGTQIILGGQGQGWQRGPGATVDLSSYYSNDTSTTTTDNRNYSVGTYAPINMGDNAVSDFYAMEMAKTEAQKETVLTAGKNYWIYAVVAVAVVLILKWRGK